MNLLIKLQKILYGSLLITACNAMNHQYESYLLPESHKYIPESRKYIPELPKTTTTLTTYYVDPYPPVAPQNLTFFAPIDNFYKNLVPQPRIPETNNVFYPYSAEQYITNNNNDHLGYNDLGLIPCIKELPISQPVIGTPIKEGFYQDSSPIPLIKQKESLELLNAANHTQFNKITPVPNILKSSKSSMNLRKEEFSIAPNLSLSGKSNKSRNDTPIKRSIDLNALKMTDTPKKEEITPPTTSQVPTPPSLTLNNQISEFLKKIAESNTVKKDDIYDLLTPIINTALQRECSYLLDLLRKLFFV